MYQSPGVRAVFKVVMPNTALGKQTREPSPWRGTRSTAVWKGESTIGPRARGRVSGRHGGLTCVHLRPVRVQTAADAAAPFPWLSARGREGV